MHHDHDKRSTASNTGKTKMLRKHDLLKFDLNNTEIYSKYVAQSIDFTYDCLSRVFGNCIGFEQKLTDQPYNILLFWKEIHSFF